MIEKVFFQPGDLVTLKQDIPNKPIMIVVKKKLEPLNWILLWMAKYSRVF